MSRRDQEINFNKAATSSGSSGSSNMGAPAIIGAAATGVQALSSAFGKGGSKETSGYTLPPEIEYQFIEYANQWLDQANQDYQRLTEVENAYQQKLDIYAKGVEGTLLSDTDIQALNESTMNIAKNMGMSAEELVSQGFLGQDDVDAINELRALEDANFSDPRLDNQLSDERAKLEQDLARSGVSPAQRAQALAEFDRRADESRFTRAEEMRTGKFNRLTQTFGMRKDAQAMNFGLASGTVNMNQGLINQQREGYNQLGNFATQGFNASHQTLQSQAALREQQKGIFQTLGEFKFSGAAQSDLRSGNTSWDATRGGSVNPQARKSSGNQYMDNKMNSMSDDELYAAYSRAANSNTGKQQAQILKSEMDARRNSSRAR
jgi:hypothetical protein